MWIVELCAEFLPKFETAGINSKDPGGIAEQHSGDVVSNGAFQSFCKNMTAGFGYAPGTLDIFE